MLHSRASMEDFWAGRLKEVSGWVALAGKDVVGFSTRDGDVVTALYVSEQFRGRGIGSKLLQLTKGQRRKVALWTFKSNARALDFYRRKGFVVIKETAGENKEKLPDVLLEWRST